MILALCSDLFFAPTIHNAATAAGLGFEVLDQYKTPEEFLALLHEKQPTLIVLDLNTSLPWPEWLPAAKGDRQVQGLPWLAYGSHMNPRRLAAARHAGADKVVPKSQFNAELSELIASLI
jgi:DNA-binding NarL/FixJ family response regulator